MSALSFKKTLAIALTVLNSSNNYSFENDKLLLDEDNTPSNCIYKHFDFGPCIFLYS